MKRTKRKFHTCASQREKMTQIRKKEEGKKKKKICASKTLFHTHVCLQGFCPVEWHWMGGVTDTRGHTGGNVRVRVYMWRRRE